MSLSNKTTRTMKKSYKILRTDGTSERLNRDKELSLEEMQQLVGGLIEYFTHHGETFVCNEEAKMFIQNFDGSSSFGTMYGHFNRNAHFLDIDIYGDVIVMGRSR